MALNQLLSLPAATAGAAPASSSSAWSFGSSVTLSSSLSATIAVYGIQFQNTDIPALDVNQDILFEITVGGITKLQVPFNMKADTLVGYNMTSGSSNKFFFPEPYRISAGSSVKVKVTDSIAAALTYDGFKLLYKEIETPLATTLIDNFDDNSINTTLWSTQLYSGTVSETGQQLVITPTNNTADDGASLISNYSYDLTSSSICVQVVQVTNGSCNTFLRLYNGTGQIYMFTESGTLYASKKISGVQTNLASIAYDATDMAYWRIRESGGTTYYEYSADRRTWTALHSVASPITVMGVFVSLDVYEWEMVNPVGSAIYDNLNTDTGITLAAPTALTTSLFAPTVVATDNKAVTSASPTSLATSTFAPTVVTGSNMNITFAAPTSLTILLFAPTVAATNNKFVTTAAPTALITSLFAPTVTSTNNKSVTTATPTILTTTKYAPTIVVTDNKQITFQVQSLILTPYAVNISVSDNKSVTTATPTALSISLLTPTIVATDNKFATPSTLTLTTSRYAISVVVTDNKFATPSTASLTIALYAPNVVVPVNTQITPMVAEMITSLFAPTVTSTSTFFAPYYYDGSEWIKKPVKHWNGSEWEEKIMRGWNGSDWVA